MAPPPKKGMSKGVLGAVVAVVVIVVLILALMLAGVIPGLKSSSGGGGGGNSGPSYNVTFSETGLPSGTSWSVTIGGSSHPSTTTSVVVKEQNGSYSWSASAVGYKATPASGTIVVSGGQKSQSVTFAVLPPGSYSVTFTESNLPTGTNWSVTFNNSLGSSTTATIVFTIGNGTWSFTVGTVSGYTASPATGTVPVSGGPASQGIAFTSNGGGGGPQLYSQAKPVADSTVAPHSSSAVLVFALGIDSRNAYTNSTTNTTNNTCPLSGGSTGTVTLPTFNGNYHSGESPSWIFIYYQASPLAEFAVIVLNGAGTYVGEVTGSSCVGSSLQNSTIPSNPIDSSAAGAAAAGSANGSTFIAANSAADADYVLFETNKTTGAVWIVTFTTCSAGFKGSGSEVLVEVNATSGAVLFSFGPIPTTCSGSPVFIVSGGGHLIDLGSTILSFGGRMVAATVPRE